MQMGSNLVTSIPNLKKKNVRSRVSEEWFPTVLSCPDIWVPTRGWRNTTDCSQWESTSVACLYLHNAGRKPESERFFCSEDL